MAVEPLRFPTPSRFSRSPLVDYLASSRVFGVLPPRVLEDLGPEILERTYPKGHYLYYAGDPAVYVFLLRSGIVAMSSPEGQRGARLTMVFREGDAFGFGSTLLGREWDWATFALADAQVLLIRKETFDRLYQRYPDLVRQVSQEMFELFRRSQQTTVLLALTPISARVAAFLLESATRLPRSQSGHLGIELPLSHGDLGLVLGTTRESVTRAFACLTRRKLIAVRGHRVLLLDPEGLLRLAEG